MRKLIVISLVAVSLTVALLEKGGKGDSLNCGIFGLEKGKGDSLNCGIFG